MLDLIRELFPICRSIAGPGLRETLTRVQRHIPIKVHEVPTGTTAFDWKVPPEWTLRRATLRGPDGRLIADTDVHNLHVLNYSTPFAGTVSREQLEANLHSMPDKPDWIPYRTSYYKPAWGICLPHRIREAMPAGDYDVCVDTSIDTGFLTYGEIYIPGVCEEEILFSTHCCHPSLANDNLSGIAVAVELAKRLISRSDRPYLSTRIVFLPGTIGSITWLSRNVEATRSIVAGLVLSCLGDAGEFTYKRSRRGMSIIDRVVANSLKRNAVRDFVPYGYDERQYCSPGFNLPVGCLMRTPNGEYPEYHTSADNPSFLRESSLNESVEFLLSIHTGVGISLSAGTREQPTAIQGSGKRFRNLSPFCEPQLGRRDLYAMTGGHASVADLQMALLWVLNYSDGLHGIDWIAQRSKIDPKIVSHAAELLVKANLLARE